MKLIWTKPSGACVVERVCGLAISSDRVLIYANPDATNRRVEPEDWKTLTIVTDGTDMVLPQEADPNEC